MLRKSEDSYLSSIDLEAIRKKYKHIYRKIKKATDNDVIIFTCENVIHQIKKIPRNRVIYQDMRYLAATYSRMAESCADRKSKMENYLLAFGFQSQACAINSNHNRAWLLLGLYGANLARYSDEKSVKKHWLLSAMHSFEKSEVLYNEYLDAYVTCCNGLRKLSNNMAEKEKIILSAIKAIMSAPNLSVLNYRLLIQFEYQLTKLITDDEKILLYQRIFKTFESVPLESRTRYDWKIFLIVAQAVADDRPVETDKLVILNDARKALEPFVLKYSSLKSYLTDLENKIKKIEKIQTKKGLTAAEVAAMEGLVTTEMTEVERLRTKANYSQLQLFSLDEADVVSRKFYLAKIQEYLTQIPRESRNQNDYEQLAHAQFSLASLYKNSTKQFQLKASALMNLTGLNLNLNTANLRVQLHKDILVSNTTLSLNEKLTHWRGAIHAIEFIPENQRTMDQWNDLASFHANIGDNVKFDDRLFHLQFAIYCLNKSLEIDEAVESRRKIPLLYYKVLEFYNNNTVISYLDIIHAYRAITELDRNCQDWRGLAEAHVCHATYLRNKNETAQAQYHFNQAIHATCKANEVAAPFLLGLDVARYKTIYSFFQSKVDQTSLLYDIYSYGSNMSSIKPKQLAILHLDVITNHTINNSDTLRTWIQFITALSFELQKPLFPTSEILTSFSSGPLKHALPKMLSEAKELLRKTCDDVNPTSTLSLIQEIASLEQTIISLTNRVNAAKQTLDVSSAKREKLEMVPESVNNPMVLFARKPEINSTEVSSAQQKTPGFSQNTNF